MKVWFSVFAGEMVALECTDEQPEVQLKFTSVHEDQEDAIVRFYASPDRSWPLAKADLPLIPSQKGLPFCTMTAQKKGSSMLITLEQLEGKRVSVLISFASGSAVLTEIKESVTKASPGPRMSAFSPGEPKRPVLSHEKAVGERTSGSITSRRSTASQQVSGRVSASDYGSPRKEPLASAGITRRDSGISQKSGGANLKIGVPVVIVLAIAIVGVIAFLNRETFTGSSDPVPVVNGTIETEESATEIPNTEPGTGDTNAPSLNGTATVETKTYELVVYFSPESAVLTSKTLGLLKDFVQLHKNVKSAVITGHCALFDDEAERISLSNDRAQAVAKWLKASWPSVEFSINGLGGQMPVTKVPEQQSLNRRVVIVVTE